MRFLIGIVTLCCALCSSFTPSSAFSIHLLGIHTSTGHRTNNNIAIEGSYALIANDNGLRVIDISDPGFPTLVGSSTGDAESVAGEGTLAFVGDSVNGLRVFDISTPTSPTLLATLATPGSAEDIDVSGNLIALADGIAGVQIIDVSVPTAPVIVGTFVSASSAVSVAIDGNSVLIAERSTGIEIIDVSTPATPVLVGALSTSYALDVISDSGTAYVADRNGGLRIIDISNPAIPTLLGTYDTPDEASGVSVSGDYAYVADANSGLQVIDISVPSTPTLSASYTTPQTAIGSVAVGSFSYILDEDSLFIFRSAEATTTLGLSPTITVDGERNVLSNHDGEPMWFSQHPSIADTIVIYGGPDSIDGKFQTLLYGGLADPQGWLSIGTVPLPETEAYGHLIDPSHVTEPTPCNINSTPFWGFVDDGIQVPGSPGTPCLNWCYGPFGYVVNNTGGLGGTTGIHNAIVSPATPWAIGAGPDPDDMNGAFLEFDVWRHMPFETGIVYGWGIRSSNDGGATWGDWRDRNDKYFNRGDEKEWYRVRHAIGDLVPLGTTHIQARLTVQDLADSGTLPGSDSTPAPFFDNVSIARYRAIDAMIVLKQADLFQDAFPQSGLTDLSSMAARDLLDVRLDTPNGDSLVARIVPLVSDVGISNPFTQIQLVYSLSKNPRFENAIRSNAPTSPGGSTSGHLGWEEHEGIVGAQPVFKDGELVLDSYSFDLPDQDFMYPGDILQYYIRVEDDNGWVTTLPKDISGFDDRVSKGPDPCMPGLAGRFSIPREFLTRGLSMPWIPCCDPNDPDCAYAADMLVINGATTGELDVLLATLNELGLYESAAFDVYNVRGAGSRLNNGLGSTGGFGASAAQLDRYQTVLYIGGNHELGLSDGSGTGFNDLSDDLSVLNSWFTSAADRSLILMGDNLMTGLSECVGWCLDLGVQFSATDVRPEIHSQVSPMVAPTGASAGFLTSFALLGGCPTVRTFDWITPAPGAVATHSFLNPGATPYVNSAAGVLWDRMDGGSRKVSMVFPFDPSRVATDVHNPAPARRQWLAEVLDIAGPGGVPQVPVATPELPTRELLVDAPTPNPFNPSTTIRFEAPRAGRLAVHVYDIRGRRVATVLDDEVPAGEQTVSWNGIDHKGLVVSSGVYFVTVRGFGTTKTHRVALIK